MASQLRVDKIVPVDGVPTGGGGGIIQMVTGSSTTRLTAPTNTGSYYNTYVNATITPKFNTSKILISFQQLGEFSTASHSFHFAIERAISGGSTTTIEGDIGSDSNKSAVFTLPLLSYQQSDADTTVEVAHCSNYLDSPATTSAVTYKIKVQCHEAITGTYFYNRTVLDNNANHSERGLSWITVMEVSA